MRGVIILVCYRFAALLLMFLPSSKLVRISGTRTIQIYTNVALTNFATKFLLQFISGGLMSYSKTFAGCFGVECTGTLVFVNYTNKLTSAYVLNSGSFHKLYSLGRCILVQKVAPINIYSEYVGIYCVKHLNKTTVTK